MKIIKDKRYILLIIIFILIAYRGSKFSSSINDLNDMIYYVFFYIGVDMHNMMSIMDMSNIFLWQCVILIGFGSFFREMLLSNETILYTRMNKRCKIYLHFIKEVMFKVGALMVALIILVAAYLGGSFKSDSYENIFALMFCIINTVTFINVFSIILDVKYLVFIFLFVEYMIWNTIILFKKVNFLQNTLLALYVNREFRFNDGFFIMQAAIFVILNIIGIWMLDEKESV